MGTFRLLICGVISMVAATVVLAQDARLMRWADIHGDTIVFTYEDDLWLAPAAGGDARRLTRDDGAERYARFSPDGSMIAFTGSYDGGTDVYVVAATGGVPRRLTWHPSNDRVLDWTPDGSAVLFRADRDMPFRAEELYTVAIAGDMPRRLPVDRGGLASLSPDGTRIAYNRVSREDRTWKRHQGGTAQDLWLGSLAAGDFTRITDWVGTDNYPMWAPEGLYFTSDRRFGTLNLYRYDVDSGEVTAVTESRDYDVKYPSLGPGAIVFQLGEQLHVLDLESGTTRVVPVRLASDRVPVRPELAPVGGDYDSFRLSADGSRVVVAARGEIVELPADEDDGEPGRNLSRSSGAREKHPVWSPDGSRLAFVSDRSGEEELWLAAADGREPRQLTDDGRGFRLAPVWSPDGRWLLYADRTFRLLLVEAESGAATEVDRGEWDDTWYRWGILDYVFSPDSKWIAYTKVEGSLNDSVFLHEIASGRRLRVTGPETPDFSPSFSPDGRYLWFLSRRSLSPTMGRLDQNHVYLEMTLPYLVLLAADQPSPFAPAGAGAAAEEAGETGEVTVRVDAEGLERRVLAVPGIAPGEYHRLEATASGCLFLKWTEPGFLKYQQVTDTTGERLELWGYDLEAEEASKLIEGVTNYHLSEDGKKLVYRAGPKLGVVDAGAEAKVGDGAVDVAGFELRVDRLAEFRQIFDEAWRIQRDWFYDPAMHGVDWAAIGEKYRRFVPSCGNRADLNYLIGEMIGELNAGHTYVSGGDFGDRGRRVRVGLLGVDWETPAAAGRHRIARIVPGNHWHPDERSPLESPGCGIRAGWWLQSIDGVEVTAADSVHAFLEDTVGRTVAVTASPEPEGTDAVTCRVEPLESESTLRYRAWVEANRRAVEAASGGRLGYLHIPDMMDSGLVEFARGWYHDWAKQGFILDERGNGGGFVGDQIIDRLERRVWALTKPREGRPVPNPERVSSGHLAVLVNQDTGSNGEYFAEAIKIRGLAKVIGTRTWGGAIGIEPHQDLVDGGSTTPPQFGPYGLDGRWLIEGHGVEPDLVVDNLPADVLAGRDPQLEAAIAYLLKQIDADPRGVPDPPPYPDKSKPE